MYWPTKQSEKQNSFLSLLERTVCLYFFGIFIFFFVDAERALSHCSPIPHSSFFNPRWLYLIDLSLLCILFRRRRVIYMGMTAYGVYLLYKNKSKKYKNIKNWKANQINYNLGGNTRNFHKKIFFLNWF